MFCGRRHRDRVVRRGLALIIESDFYATEPGRQHFADQLTSIRYCVQETCNFDTLYAYLTCGNYDFNYDRLKNLRPKRNIRTAMHHEIMMYGIAQKEELGFDKAVEECKYRMSRYGVTPNMLVLPPQMLLYMALAPEAKLTYKEGGPAAEARFEAGVAGFEARSFRNCGVFTSEPFEVSDDQDSVQMLTRASQIGEFYVMMPPQVQPGDGSIEAGKHTCDIMIYDEEADRHVRITWLDALRACLVGAEGVDVGTEMSGGQNVEAWRKAATAWAIFNGDMSVDKETDEESEPSGEELLSGNVYKKTMTIDGASDVRIVVARPFIEHMMHSVVLAVAGRDTGATLFGPADMQLSVSFDKHGSHSSASIPEEVANRLLFVPFAGQHPSQDDRGVRLHIERAVPLLHQHSTLKQLCTKCLFTLCAATTLATSRPSSPSHRTST